VGFVERAREEYRTISGVMRALRLTVPIGRNPTHLFPDVLAERARTHGDKPALTSARETLSYRQLDERANRYAHWALAQEVARGETVALLMPNRPEYLAIWAGICRAGGAVALLNTNLTGEALAHCVTIAEPRHVIVAAELAEAFAAAAPLVKSPVQVWRHGGEGEGEDRLDHAVEDFSEASLTDAEKVALTIEDRALYIYTSGTTGLPKAANINHYRLMAISHGFCGVMGITPDDRMYACLPMYHTSGGVIACGAPLVAGASVFIREKFSARDFWREIVENRSTLVMYIGELCRYLLNTSEDPFETRHKVRLFCGNGLRPDIWRPFKERFRIPRILEWYAATEGNVALFNWSGREGAIGRIPWYLKSRFPVKVLRFDHDKEEPVRGSDGLCVEAPPGEIGELVGEIVNDPSKPASRFEGYADKAATEKKVLRDVGTKGDRWFRTGDLVWTDAQGYFYFADRIGDTFRWKGENVSTSQVAEALTQAEGVQHANVYGVEVPGADGRAGMAALVVDKSFDLGAFAGVVDQRLPDYARPLFLRLTHDLDATGTFKPKKVELKADGFDPDKVKDPLYFRSAGNGYVPLDAAAYAEICAGKLLR
jgi:fatty-acyl-CoA synthase